MGIQTQLDKLKEIELLCSVLMRQSEKSFELSREYREGMNQAGRMVLEIINRKGEQL
jgi:hypothetical protein